MLPINAMAHVQPPTAYLVGAGPGDPELLTLKALRVLRAATVILIDDLVGEQVLHQVLEPQALAPRIVHVGKRGGCASTPQDFICKLMVREALAGERVARLKGGDPLVFGRAGEELAALRAAGVPVEVVNGITSGLAAVNALDTSWTDRHAGAQGVLLVTGHPQPGSPGPDWDAIAAVAASGITLVVYMGVQRAPRDRGGPAHPPAGRSARRCGSERQHRAAAQRAGDTRHPPRLHGIRAHRQPRGAGHRPRT